MRKSGELVRVCALLALVSGSLPAFAETTASEVQAWLDRMARAVETLNYRGTLVHWHDGRVDTLGIVHRADESGIRERIYSLDGEPREILRDGDEVRCLLAGDQPLVVQRQLATRLIPNLPLNRLGGPKLAYDMSLGGRERVAGMMAQIVKVSPRDQYRYGYQFWLEEKTGMLLRSALLDHRGRRLQQLSFVTVELGVPISDRELEPVLIGGIESTLQTSLPSGEPVQPRHASWQPAKIPHSFNLVHFGAGHSADGSKFEHLLYSDGLANFSVYVEDGRQGYTSSRLESIGPVHVFTGLLDGRQVTVVGEVPRTTVEYVGRSLRQSAGPRRRH
ncbi:MAG: MucB/RseB C-terminal domain-containing protein [Wenzhouxiangella sp.]